MVSPAPSKATIKLGKRVRALRDELEWTQEDLADAAGMHWTYVGQIERGLRNLSLTNLLKLAVALKVDPGDLVKGLKP